MKKETIYLAGGCFWGTEKYMQGVDGVLETRVGYALGEKPLWNPPLKESVTYEEVCNHSGHAEAVEVVFDAEKISLTEILREYCYTIDPTSLGRQGMDIGIQYRTGIYSLTEEQRQTAQAFLDTSLFKRRSITRNILKKIPMAIAISILRKLRRRRRRKRKSRIDFSDKSDKKVVFFP